MISLSLLLCKFLSKEGVCQVTVKSPESQPDKDSKWLTSSLCVISDSYFPPLPLGKGKEGEIEVDMQIKEALDSRGSQMSSNCF